MNIKQFISACVKLAAFLLVLSFSLGAYAQECPDLKNGLNGAVDVSVDVTISWDPVPEIPGYIIRLGTTPGGSDILERSVGSATTFTPDRGLPDDTLIYVTIVLDFLFEGGEDIVCPSQSFRTIDVTTAPGCANITFPVDQAVGVSIQTFVIWDYASTATGYRISMGTSPGGTEILNDLDVGNNLTYNPPGDLDPDTTYYVSVTPYNENGQAGGCAEIEFTTGQIAALPTCTSMISPFDGEVNVPLTPLLEWNAVPGATGYRVTIGTTPFNANILDDVTFFTNSTFVINFLPNLTFFIQITPFNDAGDALGCGQESFSTQLGCGPYFNPQTQEFETFSPEIDFPELISFCEQQSPYVVTVDDVAEGYRWYKIDSFGGETVISETNSVTLGETGSYRYEAYNYVSQSGNVIECPSIQPFEVVSSEIATINSIDVREQGTGIAIVVNASGIGDYEYSIDSPDGPYQDSPEFNNVLPGSYTVYVRDKNGCGIVQDRIVQDLTISGFPKFFTPNGDGVNDYWQFIPPREAPDIRVKELMIFDRYGTLLVQVEPTSIGWDGTFNGKPLPAAVYWYRAMGESNNTIIGYFALKR